MTLTGYGTRVEDIWLNIIGLVLVAVVVTINEPSKTLAKSGLAWSVVYTGVNIYHFQIFTPVLGDSFLTFWLPNIIFHSLIVLPMAIRCFQIVRAKT
jgi:hypothetical protein